MAWPTSQNPKTEFVTCRFSASEAAELDAATQLAGMGSRSAFVRDAVRRVIAADRRKAQRLAGNAPRDAGEAVTDDG